MSSKGQEDKYNQRLSMFLSQIKTVQSRHSKKDLYFIMDTVPFRDLETALMMATMDTGGRQ